MRTDLTTVEHRAPGGAQQVIFLTTRLSLQSMGAFHTAYQSVAKAHNGVVSPLELRVLLLMSYLHNWRGGVLDTVPCDPAALNILDADMPILTLAMDAAYLLHFAETPLPTEERGEPVNDERHAALVKRWDKKLGIKSATTYQAGTHDGIVALMARFGWTEQQATTENSPEVLAELYARLEAEDTRAERERKKHEKRSGKGRAAAFPTSEG